MTARSISWGMAKDAPQGWTAQARRAYDQAFQDAAALGVTVCCAVGDADPLTGYRVGGDGQEMVIGGTSAVAPLYAGLSARISAQLGGSSGFVTPKLYAGGVMRDIVDGGNDEYSAGAGLGRVHRTWKSRRSEVPGRAADLTPEPTPGPRACWRKVS